MTTSRGAAPAPAKLEVWGDPIAHSRSPQLHAAAYRALGLEWSYDRRRVDEASFGGELAGLDAGWRGLSLTMPLKEAAFAAAAHRDRRAELTGAVNTLLLNTAGGPHGFNTDVGGLVQAFAEAGITRIDTARIVGAGSTAASALVALQEMGAQGVEVAARRPERAAPLVALGETIGVTVVAASLVGGSFDAVDVTIATLPSGTELDDADAAALAAGGGVLLDVAYAPWPSHLAVWWGEERGEPLSGLSMLLHQAVLQVRIFVSGDVDAPLPDEDAVIASMRSALVGD